MTPTLPTLDLTETKSALNSTPAASNSETSGATALEVRRELSLWLAAISSFVQPTNRVTQSADAKNALARNWSRELRALQNAAMRAAFLTSQFGAKYKTLEFEPFAEEVEAEDFAELYLIFSRFVALCDEPLRHKQLDFYGWTNLCDSLLSNLVNARLPKKLAVTHFGALPESLLKLNQHPKARQPFGKEFLSVVVALHNLLEVLKVVGTRLESDLPIKNSLLFFSFVGEETQNLMRFIEERILRFMPAEHDFFDLLDGTIYIISLELKKVYTHELTGIFEIRPAPGVTARVETAHGLLQDCFQQSIIMLAKAFDPEIEGWQIFPNYQTRLEQSLILRTDLWNALQNVQKAENAPDAFPPEKLKNALEHLRQNSLQFLMFKDCEPTERFIEEIVQTRRLADITHVLHRFGAYLETLLGQVNMRGVLTNHPFEYQKNSD